MNLSNFKSEIPPQIVQRGETYFNEGAIMHIQSLKNGEWIAEVEGNYDDYIIEVTVDNTDEITSCFCNCPYDGNVCKHVVAVLLSIKQKGLANSEQSTKKRTKPEWHKIIEELPEKELRNFIKDFASNNEKLQNELVINFSKPLEFDNTAKYTDLILNIFDAASDHYGFIQYRDTYAAMHPVYNLLKKAKEHIQNDNLHEAFSIAAAAATTAIDTIQNMDDSNGECGGVITEAFETIDSVLEDCNNATLFETIYSWLLGQMENSDYENYGCEDVLEDVFLRWSDTSKRIALANDFLNKKIELYSNNNDWSAKYRYTKYIKFKLQMLANEGKNSEAEMLIDQNIHIQDFRKIRVLQYLENNDFSSAIQFIKEGIKIAENENLAGIVHNWKKQLLEIYQTNSNTKELSKLSKNLFKENTGTIEYYRIYKNTVPPASWAKARDEIIKFLTPKKGKYYWGSNFSHDLARVYIEEKMWADLFIHVKENPDIDTVTNYDKYLKDDYSSELIEIYTNAILDYAQNTGRKIYQDIKQYLKQMAKLKGGLSKAKSLKNELLEKYKNRPAMKEEFEYLWD